MCEAKIFQINRSGGGVPKMPIAQARIGADGIEGDVQADLKHHGGPDRALSIYSLERIHTLQAEGHPIQPGSTGENLTISGLDWDRVVPGATLHLGEQVRVEITSYTEPCSTIAGSFLHKGIKRMLQSANPGSSRVYARVIEGGVLKAGDPVSLRPANPVTS